MMMMAVMMVMTISANAMSYNAARNEALFLSDKMAYELDLTEAQYDAVYEINLDYLLSLDEHGDIFGIWWERRNADLRYVLTSWQFDLFMSHEYFYRPVAWVSGAWRFAVYTIYDRGIFYHPRPRVYVSYRGGNSHRDSRFYANRHFGTPRLRHHNSVAYRYDRPNSHYGHVTTHHRNDRTSVNRGTTTTTHHSGNANMNHGNTTTTTHHSGSANMNHGNTTTTHHSGSANMNYGGRSSSSGQLAQNSSSHHSSSGRSSSSNGSSTRSSGRFAGHR